MQKCIICENKNFRPIFNNTLKKCQECGFVTANLEISKQELERYYSSNYFNGEEYLDYLNDKNVIQYNFNKRLKKIEKIISGVPLDDVLEIGCAYGFFGELILRKYPNCKYKGFDVSKEAIEYGKNNFNLDLSNIDYLEKTNEPNKYSHIFMWDVVEHLKEPHHFLEKISYECKDDAYIYITTGDIGRILPKIQGKKWRLIHPPTHLHYFTKNTLSLLLEKYGFEKVHSSYPAVYRSLNQIFYSLFILQKGNNKFKQYIFNKLPQNRFLGINTQDIIFMVAKKAPAKAEAQSTQLIKGG